MPGDLPDLPTNNKHIFLVGNVEAGLRLDKFLSKNIPDLSRTKIQSLVKNFKIKNQNSILSDQNYSVKLGETIEVIVEFEEKQHASPADIPLDVVYEDADLLVLNKQAGLTVHPGAGNHSDTLVNALVAHFGDKLSKLGGVERPGIVHRLDRDTSGLMVIAKTDKAHASLGKQIEKRALKRVYNALVFGVPNPASGRIEKNIGRSKVNRKKMAVYRKGQKSAITNYKVIEKYGDTLSLVECRLETGRTHQIRVHMTAIGHSLVGDQTYGNPKKKLPKSCPELIQEQIKNFPRQALHSVYIAFQHPTTSKTMEFSAALPDDIKNLIKLMR